MQKVWWLWKAGSNVNRLLKPETQRFQTVQITKYFLFKHLLVSVGHQNESNCELKKKMQTKPQYFNLIQFYFCVGYESFGFTKNKFHCNYCFCFEHRKHQKFNRRKKNKKYTQSFLITQSAHSIAYHHYQNDSDYIRSFVEIFLFTSSNKYQTQLRYITYVHIATFSIYSFTFQAPLRQSNI